MRTEASITVAAASGISPTTERTSRGEPGVLPLVRRRFFAGTVLGLAGVMRIFDSIWAFRYHGALPTNFEGALFGHSLKTYGWFYLIVGIVLIGASFGVLIGASFGVLVGSQFSRWAGIIAGSVLAISAIWWMPYYPVWSLVYIGLGILVFYGLVSYGGRDRVEQSVS